MNLAKCAVACAAVASLAFAQPAFAAINGDLEVVHVAMYDSAEGWVCRTPYYWQTVGVLSVYIDDGAGGSWHYGDFSLDESWGHYRPDIASMCNGYEFSGFSLWGWFYQNRPTTMWVYFKNSQGTLTLLGGPITMYGEGPWY